MSKAVVTCLRQTLSYAFENLPDLIKGVLGKKASFFFCLDYPGRLFQDWLLGFDGRDSLMSSCRMWTSQLSLIHPSPPPSPTTVLHSCSISQATSSSVRNSFSGTLDIVIINPSIELLFSTEIMRQHHLKLTND